MRAVRAQVALSEEQMHPAVDRDVARRGVISMVVRGPRKPRRAVTLTRADPRIKSPYGDEFTHAKDYVHLAHVIAYLVVLVVGRAQWLGLFFLCASGSL